jgi:CheY-like chemotaxis protein
MTAPHDPRILLVDDDVDTCRNLTDILSDLGYRVDAAHDGPTALAMVRATPYDVALLDLRMPGMSGQELYREIKKLGAGTVALLVTAYASRDTADEALKAGAWQVLSKPVDFPRLLGLVDEALNQPLVLVVDDDRELCASLWDLFRDRGYRVALAHSAGEAARQIGHADYKVVLIDMRLPGADGGEVFHRVREANPQTRTLLITGFRSETNDLVARVLAEGADAVCYKPFEVPRLLDTLRDLAGEAPGGTPG